MSVADDIINGTYGKKKKKKTNTADAIINNTYKPSSSITTGPLSVLNTQKSNTNNINSNQFKTNSVTDKILGIHNNASSLMEIYEPKTLKSNDNPFRQAGKQTKEGYKTTGKVYGDYFYQGYKDNKNLPIVEKDGKYYVYNEKAPSEALKYQDVDKMSFLTKGDAYEKAVKQGYKGSQEVREISNQIKLDTSNLTTKQKEEYTKDIQRQEKAEAKQQKHDNRVRYGGAGLKGSLGELEYLFGNAKNTTEKEIVDPVKNFGDNYETGKMNNELALEYYKKMQGKENRVDELEKEVETYNKFNQDLLTNPGATGKASQNLNTQVESLKHQGITATILGGIGAGIGTVVNPGAGTVAGAKIGGALGYTFGATPYTYKLESGNQYKALLEMGVPDDIATKYAKITGGVNAGIESGEKIIDLATLGFGGKASSKVSKEAVNEMVEEYGESTVKKWLKSKIGEESANKVISIAKTGVKFYAQNIGSETLEEMAQEGVSIGGEIGATKEAGIEREATFKDDFERIKQAGIDSAISTAFTGPLSSAGGVIVTRTMNSVGKKADSKALESNVNKQITNYEKETGTKFTTDEKKQLLSGTINAIKDIKNKETKTLSEEEQALTQQQFVYEAKDTDSTYRQELAKSSDVLNNSTAHHELFELASKVSEDTKTTYRFTNDSKEEMINEKNRFIENFAKNENISIEEARERIQDLTIDGFVNDKGEVIINADSKKALNVILGHETTHLLEGTKEYESLKKALYKLADTKGDLNPLRDSMTKLYDGTNANIENEITSELAGEYLYTNQDFINNLATEQPNVFQRIYNYLNHLYKKVTADSKEARQLEEVIYRYKQAYNKISKPTTQESETNLAVEVESNTLNNDNEVKISSKDNKGRTLSKEQQERFKDTKVRDEEGNLLTVYHGTRADFNIFENQKSGDNYEGWSYSGKGFYFTDDIKEAKDFGDYSLGDTDTQIKEVYLNITNPFDTSKVYKDVFEDLAKKYDIEEQFLSRGDNLLRWFRINKINASEVLKEYGFDGVMDFGHYLVYDSSQIKNVDNTKPTDSPDIRYSINYKKDGSNYIKVDTDQHIFENAEPKDFRKIAKKYMNDYLRGQSELGSINSEEKVNIGTKGINKYTNPGKRQNYFNEKMKLSPELQNILEVAKKISESEASKENSKYSKWEYYEFDFNIDGKDFTGVVNIGVDGEGNKHFYEINKIQQKNTGGIYPLRDNRHSGVSDTNISNNREKVKYSLSDNQGRTLSKEQQEFFKDSKVRDEKGNLLTVYHGGNGDYSVFDKKFFNTNEKSGDYVGEGFYFAKSKGTAYKYGNNVKEVYLNMTNPLIINTEQEAKDYRASFDGLYKPTDPEEIRIQQEIKAFVKDYDYFELMKTNPSAIREEVQKRGYDGLIDNLYGQYAVFNSNQIKNVDNTNPTTNEDIRYSLSDDNIAPIGGDYRIYGNKALQEQGLIKEVESAIAPLQEKIQELSDKIDDIAPVNEKTLPGLEQIYNDKFNSITENDIPVRNNLTIEESKELDYLEAIPSLTNDERIRLNELQEKENPSDIIEEEPIKDPLEDRGDWKEIGKRSVKAFQYENPEVQPYFKEEAQAMIGELQNDYVKGERFVTGDISQLGGGDYEYSGTKRLLANDIAELKDTYGYSKEVLINGLNRLIHDKGQENIAVAKRLETIISDRLLNGYTATDGTKIPANREYINALRELEKKQNINTSEEYLKSLENDELVSQRTAFEQAVMESNKQIEKELGYTPKDPTKESSYDDMLDAFMSRRENTNKKEKVITKPKGKLRSLVDTTRNLLVNRNQEIDNLAKESGNLNIKYAGDMLNSVAGEIEGDIYTAQTDNEGREIGKSLNSLFEPLKKDGLYDAFNDYLENYSNIDRHKQGKGSQTPLNVSEKLVREYEQQHPEFKKYADSVWQYGKNIKDNLVDAGLITQEFSDKLSEMYPHYVPYMENREMTNFYPDIGEAKPKGVIKRAKGGASNLLSIEEALTKYTYASKKAVRQNQLYQEIVGTLEDKVSIGADMRKDPTELSESLYRDENGNYLTAYVDGKQQSVRITDDLYKGLKNDLEHQVRDLEERLSLVTKPLQKASEIRRNLLTTWSPTFVITNPIKDIQDAIFNSKHTASMLKNYPSSFVELSRAKTPLAKQFLTLYGSGNNMGEYSVDSGLNKGKLKHKNTNFLKGLSKLNNIVELAPRYAEFKASIEHGASVQEAMYNAREITTNFNRGGVITKALNRNGATFLNASVQGFDKFIRNFSGENGAKGVTSSLLKATLFGVVPAVFNELVFGGDGEDEEYKALPDYIKDNYYLIKTDEGEFIRIPKGRVLSVFGSTARRTIEYSQGEEDAFDGFLKNAITQVGPTDPANSNLFTPFMQAKNNEAWYGGDLVPSRLQELAPSEQYDASTDKFSIWLGDKLNVSPYKINYVLDQYSGGIGDIALPFITEESTSPTDTFGEQLLAPIKAKFTANSTDDNKYAGDIYTLVDEMKTKPSAVKETDEYQLQMKYLNNATSQMGELYAERREVQADTTLSKSEKYAKVQAIQEQINSIAKEGLDSYKGISQTGSYASVGDQEYYKYTNDDGEEKWGTPKEEDTNDLNSMGLDLDEKSTYYETRDTISSINSKYKNTDDYAGKKKEIVDTIKNTNLPDEAKYSLYDKYYGSTDELKIMQKMGVKADSYLDYASQTFKADKDSKGKSIANSKKNKVFDYVNSMDIPFEQKVILSKLEYNSYDEYNNEIIDYLNNNPDITYEDMETILKKLGFEVDSKGNIKW